MLLLLASYVFYLFAGPKYILYIVFTTVSTYIISLRIDKLNQTQAQYLAKYKEDLSRADKRAYRDMMKGRMRRWLVACLLLNFGILAVVKYSNFAIANLNAIFQAFGGQGQLSFLDIALPMGISFYTFQTMGYIIDVYRGKYPPEKNIFKLALFEMCIRDRVPDKIAYSNGETGISFREVYDQARAIGTFLNRQGVYKEPVVVFMNRHPKALSLIHI